MLSLLAEEMAALASMVTREHKREVETRKKIV
jgi:hypothetical protein